MNDRGIHTRRLTSAGLDDAGGDEPIFAYWSFTKTVIAICALGLVERGRMTLDEPLAGHPFTLRQLLGHTAGLPDYTTLPHYHAAVANDEEPWPRDHLLGMAMKQGQLFPPGMGWSYSNVGYMLAREVMEQAAGQPLASLVRQMVGDVLGLEGVELAATRERFARVHGDAARRYHPGWVYHGCLMGTAADAARILHGLFAGRLLGAAMQEEMLLRRPLGGAIDGRPWTECGYALGLMSGAFGAAGCAIGHTGGGPFSVCAVYHFPHRSPPVTVAAFAQGRDAGVAEHAAVERSEA